VAHALSDALDELTNDDGAWVVVLTGAGEKAFSAGNGPEGLASGDANIATANGGFAGIAKRSFPKPLIAAVNGSALAGGFEIVLSCDMVVAPTTPPSASPRSSAACSRPAAGSSAFPSASRSPSPTSWPSPATRSDANRALELGLVNRVVPADELLPAAMELAERIAANAPLSVRYSKQLIHDAARSPRRRAGGSTTRRCA